MDRFGFEVVPKAEVAQHLEKCVVVSRPANVIDVPGSQTLLTSRRARKIQLDLTQEMILELVHPRRGKKNRGIPGRYQNIASLAMMPLGLEERQVLFTQLVSFHSD